MAANTVLSGNKTEAVIPDPYDAPATRASVGLNISACRTERLELVLYNRRGGHEVTMYNVPLVRELPDEATLPNKQQWRDIN